MYLSVLCTSLIVIGIFQPGYSVLTHNSKQRIVGGRNASINEYPHQVSILSSNRHICGGSIINVKFIVTAAHCSSGKSTAKLTIHVGSSLRTTTSGQIYYLTDIYVHPNFNYESFDYDISLLKVKTPIVFSASVRPISLASSGTTIRDGLPATATGWGKLSDAGKPADQLQAVTLPIISAQKCELYYKGALTKRMICAGYDEGGKDTCAGDSGGPLVVSGILVGITSWGDVCAKAKSPGVYTSVPELRTYIDSIINKM